jgi:hypothetical protein
VGAAGVTLSVRTFKQTHLPNADAPVLYAVCEVDEKNLLQRACITDQTGVLDALLAKNLALSSIAAHLHAALLDFSQPFCLQPVHIPKPWGQEIWYTGMEVRGVSQVATETGATPLTWLLSLAQDAVLGVGQQQLNLLKILDPLPEEVFGDLYFELHEKKREVYIVTHVDRSAWPDGVGAIRYGFSADKRKQFSDDATFVAAYQQAVRDYALIRRDIDAQLDVLRERDGFAENAPVSALQMQQWLQEVSASQKEKELVLRKTMESFTALRSLHEGDVLAVPLRTPHALQHGVRTIEFQTPVYERKILSFAQKVLTQSHWDTEEALQLAELDAPADQLFPVLCDVDGVRLEQIVQFDDFIVQRLSLEPNAIFVCKTAGSYVLLITVIGCVQCSDKALAAEQAVLVPAGMGEVSLQNLSATSSTVLLARPA